MSADRTSAHEEYRAARDLLLRLRGDHAAARAAFRWPRAEHFNWALDWFDVIAEGNDLAGPGTPRPTGRGRFGPRRRPGLLRQLSARSDALATALRERGSPGATASSSCSAPGPNCGRRSSAA
ncbi:AMP-binding protein [Streptomyces tanashiensis]